MTICAASFDFSAWVVNLLAQKLRDKEWTSDTMFLALGVYRNYEREGIPDWIAILAEGDRNHPESVCEVALADLEESEKNYDHTS